MLWTKNPKVLPNIMNVKIISKPLELLSNIAITPIVKK